MQRVAIALLGFSLAVGTCGCANARWDFWRAGRAQDQQRRAQKFDPYPLPDIGPAMAGTRPREFDKPLAEPVRAQLDKSGKLNSLPASCPQPLPGAPVYQPSAPQYLPPANSTAPLAPYPQPLPYQPLPQ